MRDLHAGPDVELHNDIEDLLEVRDVAFKIWSTARLVTGPELLGGEAFIIEPYLFDQLEELLVK